MDARAHHFIPALLALILSSSTGCTHSQLRSSTIAHSSTLQDIYTQQVMDNLAMFLQDPHALPFFAYPNQGTTAIQDAASVGGPGYASDPALFFTAPFSLSGARTATENWVLVPVFDPAKLALMRCAYQEAIAQCTGIDHHGTGCPDCEKLRKEFYGPPTLLPGGDGLGMPMPCLQTPGCWICWGGKHQLPKNCRLPYVGSYKGLYAWVAPEGYDMLTRLTLTILDYAVNDPRQFEKRTKSVEMTINATDAGVPGGIKVSATIPIDLPSRSLIVLENAPAYGDFLKQFGKPTAEKLLEIALSHYPYSTFTVDDKKGFWAKIDPKGKIGITQNEIFPGDQLKKAVMFIKMNQILPDFVPTQEVFDKLVNGPAVYQRKASASAGLQQLGQRLHAANAPGP